MLESQKPCREAQSTEREQGLALHLHCHESLRGAVFHREDIRKVHQRLTFSVQKWGHKNFRDFQDEKTGMEPWCLPASIAPLTVADVDPMLVEEIIVRNLPQSEEHDNSLLNEKEVEYHTKKLSQDDNQSWRSLMLMAPHLHSGSPDTSDAKAKKPRVNRNLSRSEIGIHSPLVWVQSTDTYASFDYFPLQSNESDDCEMIAGWNNCVVPDNLRYKCPETGRGLDNSMILTMSHRVAIDNAYATLESFRNYNIFHYMLNICSLSWSLINLSIVGSLDTLQDHQRQAFKETKDDINVNMSLREVFEEGLEQEGHILNALALPCTTAYDSDPLQFVLSSHCRAFEHTSDMPEDIFEATYPVSATSFWLVATKGAISYMHCDCHGVGTVVEVVCGRKLWYIFQRCGSSPEDSMIDEYMGDWAPGFIPSPDE
ncbi:hypothetical protein IW262DRAFT_1456982 [Armillaria fumosa]|nr:hypothetical protein IW262DRAFT_1456982 [Armillaria fumosa]